MNHKRSNKNNRTDKLVPHDVRWLYLWIYGWRGNPVDLDKYRKMVSQIPLPAFMKKWQISSITRVTDDGICLDCNKKRCTVCNGCPIDIFEELKNCQRCICYDEKEQLTNELLNDTGIPLDELIRHKPHKRKKEQKQ